MHTFIDYHQHDVTLSFADHPFSKAPQHVLVICLYKDQYLLTRHKERGLEFPGGKVEANEAPTAAAKREVFEETGALVERLKYIGQYCVTCQPENIIKNIYFAHIKQLTVQPTYFETLGPVLVTHLPNNLKEHDDYSFIMKDDVIPLALGQMKQFDL